MSEMRLFEVQVKLFASAHARATTQASRKERAILSNT